MWGESSTSSLSRAAPTPPTTKPGLGMWPFLHTGKSRMSLPGALSRRALPCVRDELGVLPSHAPLWKRDQSPRAPAPAAKTPAAPRTARHVAVSGGRVPTSVRHIWAR